MRFLLDTNHVTIIQYATKPDYLNFKAHWDRYPPGDIAYSVVSFHEQLIGAHALLNGARRREEVIRGYERLGKILRHYSEAIVLPFDAAAAAEFDRLRSLRVRIATMDLRVASIALAQELTVLTRNTRDFGKVPGLVTADWTV